MSAHSSNRIWWYRSTLPLVWCRSGRVYFTVVPVLAHALCRVRIGSRSRCRALRDEAGMTVLVGVHR